MAKKPKKTVKSSKPKKAKKPAKGKKKEKPKIQLVGILLVLALLFVAGYSILQYETGKDGASISNCVFSMNSNKLDCDITGSLKCRSSEDILVLVKDGNENSMVAFNTDGSSLMGYIDLSERLEAVLVSVPGEDLVDQESGCAETFLICGEEVYSSECTFV